MDSYKPKPRDEAAETIECFIIRNNLCPHDKLPSQREMCAMWSFNRVTLCSAIERLTQEGKLYSRPGSGVYVAPPKIQRNLLRLQSPTDYAREEGTQLQTKNLSFTVMPCTRQLSQKLHIPLGRPVYKLVRLRMINQVPSEIDTSYLDAQKVPDLENYNLETRSLYEILRTQYRFQLTGGEENISITYADPMEAKFLEIPENTGVFYLSGTVWDEQKTPFVCAKLLLSFTEWPPSVGSCSCQTALPFYWKEFLFIA